MTGSAHLNSQVICLGSTWHNALRLVKHKPALLQVQAQGRLY